MTSKKFFVTLIGILVLCFSCCKENSPVGYSYSITENGHILKIQFNADKTCILVEDERKIEGTFTFDKNTRKLIVTTKYGEENIPISKDGKTITVEDVELSRDDAQEKHKPSEKDKKEDKTISYSIKNLNLGQLLTKKIKYNDSEFVLRIKVKSITEYDSNGKILHTKTLKNSYSDEIEEEWYKYDEKGNEIWHGTSWGQEWWNDYNSLNWNTHGKNSDGLEWDNTFDSKGKLIRTKYTDGTEEKYFYDVKENLIKEQRNYGYEMEIKYLLNMLPMENMGMTKMSIHANMMKEVIKFTKSPPAIEVHIIQQAKNFGNLIATETKSHIQLEKVQFLLKCMIMILEKMEK